MAINKEYTLKIFETLHSLNEMSIHIKCCPLLLTVNAHKIILPSTNEVCIHTQYNISLYHCSVYAHKIILSSAAEVCMHTNW